MKSTKHFFSNPSAIRLFVGWLSLLALFANAEITPAVPTAIQPFKFNKGYVGQPAQILFSQQIYANQPAFIQGYGAVLPDGFFNSPPAGERLPYASTIITGLPPGVKLTPWGQLIGAPTKPGIYTVSMRNWNGGNLYSETYTTTWEVAPTIPTSLIGNYQAILDPHAWLNGGYGGMFKMTVTSTGQYSASITRGIHRKSFIGKLDLYPIYDIFSPSIPAETDQSAFLTLQVPRRKPYSSMELTIDIATNKNGVRVTLYEPYGDLIKFEGTKSHFSSTNPATNFIGQWNTAFEPEPTLHGYAAYPQGCGWAIQKVSPSGVITSTCRLADGTSFTQSSHIDPTGLFPLHAMLYGSKGSIQGWQTLHSSNSTITGTLRWVKSPMMGRIYAAGFPAHNLNVLGARYTPPTPGSLVFGISPGNDNARILFSQGGLSRDLNQTFTVTDKNVFIFPSGIDNPHGLRANLNVAMGLLSGSGSSIDYRRSVYGSARSGSFSAILIPGRNEAVGHFLLPADTSRHSAILSGKLIGQENSPQAE